MKFVGVYAGSNVITAAGCAVVQSSKSSVNGRLFVSFKFFVLQHEFRWVRIRREHSFERMTLKVRWNMENNEHFGGARMLCTVYCIDLTTMLKLAFIEE